MEKLKENKMKIIIAIAIIAVIVIIIAISVFLRKDDKGENNEENTIVEEFQENEIDEEEKNQIDEEQENSVEENVINETSNVNVQQTTQDQIIGREEQESINQNQGPTDEEKVIELVKNKWGANDSTVTFNIMNREGDIYMVSVNNKSTTAVMAWYQVNIATGEVIQ